MLVKVISSDREIKDFCYEPLKYGGIYKASFENKYYMRVFFFIDDEEYDLVVHERLETSRPVFDRRQLVSLQQRIHKPKGTLRNSREPKSNRKRIKNKIIRYMSKEIIKVK